MKFEDIINDVFEKEGGYVNDPKDPGGETKYGISKRAFPRKYTWIIIGLHQNLKVYQRI